ncbi:MAG TPA: hypothetical protein VF230_03370 [Acidimicrobiales bacterium]
MAKDYDAGVTEIADLDDDTLAEVVGGGFQLPDLSVASITIITDRPI